MTKKNTTIAAFVAVAVLTLAAVAYAGPHHGQMRGQMGGHGWGQGYCGQGYQALSPEQQQKADAIAQQFYQDTKPLREQMYAKRAELEALLASPNADQSRIDAVTKDIANLRSQLFEKRVKFRQQMGNETGIRMPMGRGYGHGGYHRGGGGGGYYGNCPALD
ncbi:hypothetical protein JCM16814_23030 [Desulfobaculum senezii]|jgi:zinc resistance-associated protein